MVKRPAVGPPVYENWRSAAAGHPSQGAYEFPIITDAHITGEIQGGFGPYMFLNPVHTRQGFREAVIVRVEDHLIDADFASPMERTDEAWYHGGWLKEEIAALVSLGVGIRAKPGGTTRRFDLDRDPRGKPIAWEASQEPSPPRPNRRILRNPAGQHPIEDVGQLALLPAARPDAAIALIRSARLYQDAIWIGDVEPNLCWVMLVSAVEVAAGFWRQTEETPVQRLQASRPEVNRLLRKLVART